MTQHHLVGELSVLLGELQAVTTNQVSAGHVARLRYEAEATPLTALGSVAARAMALTDGLCWDSLGRADAATFVRQAAIGAQLHEFGVCAGLLEGD